MIPSLVIGLREGVEASLIVGIIAAFLGRNGRRDALRQMWTGLLAAVALCLLIGVGLVALSRELPQRAQEGLETANWTPGCSSSHTRGTRAPRACRFSALWAPTTR